MDVREGLRFRLNLNHVDVHLGPPFVVWFYDSDVNVLVYSRYACLSGPALYFVSS